MSHSPFDTPKNTAVPHILMPGRPVDQALLENFDHLMAANVGFFVLDWAGTLTGQIYRRMPKKRIKDCCLIDIPQSGNVYGERVFSANLLHRLPTLDADDQAQVAVDTLLAVLEGDLTAAECGLLQHSCAALLHAFDVASQPGEKDWITQTYCLPKLWGMSGFREYTSNFLWEPKLRRYWQNFDQAAHQTEIAGLTGKLQFLWEKPERLTQQHGFSAVDFTAIQNGKMIFLNLPGHCFRSGSANDKRWWRYVAGVFGSQYFGSIANQNLAEALFFTSATTALSADIRPKTGAAFSAGFQGISRRYSASQYARKKMFTVAELGAICPPEHIQRLSENLHVNMQMPKDAYNKLAS